MFEIAASQGGAAAADYDKKSAEQAARQKEVKKVALRNEGERDNLVKESAGHEQREHWLAGAATLLEIGIAMSTVTIITKRRPLWLAAIAFGAAGLVLLSLGYVF